MLRSMLLVLLAACGGAARAPTATPTATPPRSDFRLGAEDVVEIVVWDNQAFSRTVPVRPDGMISLPLVDDVAAAGLTPIQLRDLLALKLKRFVSNPNVSVIVQRVHSPKVSVVGEVRHPGRFEMASPTSVLEAIALAGGFTEFASRSRIVLLRPSGDRMERYEIEGDRLTKEGARSDVWLAAGDVVMVP